MDGFALQKVIYSAKLTPVRYELCGASFIDIDLCAGGIGVLKGANLCAFRLDDQKVFYAF